jgi:integrative and conjugative element protein (TIGR02256 family)
MGRRLDNICWQIDHVIGPGPNAVHGPFCFAPDLLWQHERIAERFYGTNGQSTYVGDWHSHPGASHGKLSQKDKNAIKTIIQAPEARCASPLMMILWSGEPEWKATIWAGHLTKNWLRRPELKISSCKFKFE